MTVGSGVGAQIGFVSETTYGTYLAPTRFLRFLQESLDDAQKVEQAKGLAAGQLLEHSDMYAITTKGAGGDIEFEVKNRWMGHLLQGLMGTTVTPVQQGATAAYLQTHALVDNAGKFLTLQKGVPDLTGTARPYTYLGCKVTSAEFECGIGELLKAKFTFDSRDVSEAQSLVAATFPTNLAPFHFAQMGFKLGATPGTEAAVSGVRKVQLKIERGVADDLYYANAAGLKDEPVANERVKISGTIETDYKDKTVFADRARSQVHPALIWEFIGPLIETPHTERLTFKLPVTRLEPKSPTVGGPEVIRPSFNFVVLTDGTNNPSIEYMSRDTTL